MLAHHSQYRDSWICVPVTGTSVSPVEIARRGVEEGKARKVDVIIIDTAGRLQIDPEMMAVRVWIQGLTSSGRGILCYQKVLQHC